VVGRWERLNPDWRDHTHRSLVMSLTAIDRNWSQLFLEGCQMPLVISRLEAARLRKSV